MSTTAVELRQYAPTTRPSRRAERGTQRRSPQAHPQRLDAPTRVAVAPASVPTVHSCSVAAPVAPASTGWQLTERGYAVLVGGFAVAALFLVTMLALTFFSFSNAPLG